VGRKRVDVEVPAGMNIRIIEGQLGVKFANKIQFANRYRLIKDNTSINFLSKLLHIIKKCRTEPSPACINLGQAGQITSLTGNLFE
jgi:hypothetical protein